MPRPAHLLIACAVALLGLGVVMVQSAGMDVTHGPGLDVDAADPTAWGLLGQFVNKNLVCAVLAVAAMLTGSRVDLMGIFRSRSWISPVWVAMVLALVLCGLTLVPGMGRSANGASRWLTLGPPGVGVSFQPSELMKWTLVIALAWYCTRRRGVMGRFWWGLVPGLVLTAVASGIVVIEDLGTGSLIAAGAVVVLVAGGAKVWHLALMLPPALGGLAFAIYQEPYRIRRLTAFMDPWADAQGTGYHPIQSMLAFAQGGLGGSGLGGSVQKYYIPEDTTDFLFPILCEELGFGGAALVVGLFIAMLWIGLGICRDTEDMFGRLVGVGVLFTVGLQAVINIAVVTVVVPTKGIALPFVSMGGTGWVFTGFALGLVASLDNANVLRAEQAEKTNGQAVAGPPAVRLAREQVQESDDVEQSEGAVLPQPVPQAA
ncbi:MAG: FtsW/RodA/SpoVE family cell cycle protein [Algisphaera sp.]